MIRQFTLNKTFRVHVMDDHSDYRLIPAGVPQGSILSPGLYCIYVSDLKVAPYADTACYADDTALYASSNQTGAICRRLQRSLTRVENFFHKWKIRANPPKTQAIIFPYDNRIRRRRTTPLTLNGTPVEYTNVVKYLGVSLDRRLTFAGHINDFRKKGHQMHVCFIPFDR